MKTEAINSPSFASIDSKLFDLWYLDLEQDNGDWKEISVSDKVLTVQMVHLPSYIYFGLSVLT